MIAARTPCVAVLLYRKSLYRNVASVMLGGRLKLIAIVCGRILTSGGHVV